MSKRVMAVVEQLLADELLGEPAFRHGAPDRVMLVSGGPVSHLASWSLVAAPSTSASLYVSPDAMFYRPLRCTNRFLATFNWLTRTPLLEAEVEEWKHGSWYHSVTSCQGFGGPLREFQAETSTEPFVHSHGVDLPSGPFWSGALAYDLVQWTQPLRLQHPPDEGALLAVLWCIPRVPSLTIVPTKFVCSARTGGGAHRRRPALTVRERPQAYRLPHPHDETVSHTDETHANNVEAVRRGIVDGQVYQVNIGKHWQGEIDHPYHVFQRLMMQNPAPFSAYVHANDLGFALATIPESLLSLEGDKLQTSPIKGTCPQGDTRSG